MPRPIAPLLQAVFDDPGDDRLREVVADALMEQGDVRGEFITLQLALARGGAAPETADRALELERGFGRDWSGIPNATRVEFARGFPWMVETSEALEQPEWATVGVLILPTGHKLDSFLASAGWLTALERLSSVNLKTLRRCAPKNLPSLRAVDLSHELDFEALSHVATFPRVTELSFSAVAPFSLPLRPTQIPANLRHLRLRVYLEGALDLSTLAAMMDPNTQPLVSVETFLGVTFQFGRERVLKVSFVSEDLAVSLSDQALDTVRANVPSTFRQFEFIAAGKPANALVPDALHRWLR